MFLQIHVSKKASFFALRLPRVAVLALLAMLVFALAGACLGDHGDDDDTAGDDDSVAIAPTDDGALTVEEADADGLVLTLRPGPVTWREAEVEGTVFTSLAYPQGADRAEFGSPAIPYQVTMFAIPVGAAVEVTVDEGAAEVFDDVLLAPHQPPRADSDDTPPEFVLDEAAYESDAAEPASLVWLDDEKALRGVRCNHLWATNFRYLAAERRLLVYPEVRVTLAFAGGEDRFVRDVALRSLAFENTWAAALVNYASLADETAAPPAATSATGAEMIIITDASLLSAAQTLRDWKVRAGLDTEIRTTAQIGGTADEIAAFLQTAYETWSPRPSWVLLLGDAELIPTHYVTPHPYGGYGASCYTGSDLYYATVDGDDLLPDLSVGRLPVDTAAQADALAARLVAYQSTPPTDAAFFTRPTHAAYFQDTDDYNHYADRRFSLTMEEAYQFFANYATELGYTPQRIYYTQPYVQPLYWNTGSYSWFASWFTGALGLSEIDLPPELLRENGFSWNGAAGALSSAVNAGTFLLTHRDHGSFLSWGEPYYHKTSVDALVNRERLPVVFSINCETGWFDNETDFGECNQKDTAVSFAEAWLRNPLGGAAGIFAATRISYSGINDRLFWGWMDALYPDYIPEYGTADATYRLGDVNNYGKVYLSTRYGGTYFTVAAEEFHWLGDPHMELWTGVPQDLVVSHADTVRVDDATFVVQVDQDDALVGLAQGAEIRGRALSSGGSVEIALSGLSADAPLLVTVTKHNFRPYLGSVEVISSCDADQDGYESIACGGDDCDDGNEFVHPGVEEVCDGIDNNCVDGVDETGDALCDNGVYCDGDEQCAGADGCVAGDLPCPDDGLFCNGVETCDEDSQTCGREDPPACPDDGLFCNGDEFCDEDADQCGSQNPPSCPDDGLFCNGDEFCDEDADRCGSQNPPECPDDGLFCNGDEFCDEDADQCGSQNPPSCPDDGLFCNGDEFCDEAADECGSQNPPECPDDGLFCNGDEFCDEDADQCGSQNPPSCPDDGQFCNGDEFCDEDADQCGHQAAPSCPDDGLFCNGDEFCDEDADQCGSQNAPSCPDDGLFCNGDEYCDEGIDECGHQNAPSCPDDGLFCNGDEFCDEDADQCGSQNAPSCPDDGFFCNGGEVCDEDADQCGHQNAPECLDDGLFCNGTEFCNEVADACDVWNVPECADDESFCNGEEYCDEDTRQCERRDVPECEDDGIWCNGQEACDEDTASCAHVDVPPCEDDALWCNGIEYCDEEHEMCQRTGNPCYEGETCDEELDDCVADEDGARPPHDIVDGNDDMDDDPDGNDDEGDGGGGGDDDNKPCGCGC